MIRLHHCHESRSMRVLWLLHELGVPFDVRVYPFDASLRQPQFLTMSPAGRVPALEIDDAVMFESGAMIEYLCERFPDAGLGCGPGDSARRDWLSWVHFAETLSQHCATLNQQHEILYEDHMRSPVIMKIEVKRIEKCYAALETRLANSAYLADDRFSAADVAVGQAMFMARHYARDTDYPALKRWYATISARPGFQASLPGPDDVPLFSREFYEPWPMPEG